MYKVLPSPSQLQPSKRLRTVLTASAVGVSLLLSGCGTLTGIPSHGGGKRFATEQRLVSASIRSALKDIDLTPLRGKRVAIVFDMIHDEGGGSMEGGRLSLLGSVARGVVSGPATSTSSAFQVFDLIDSGSNYSNSNYTGSSTAGTTIISTGTQATAGTSNVNSSGTGSATTTNGGSYTNTTGGTANTTLTGNNTTNSSNNGSQTGSSSGTNNLSGSSNGTSDTTGTGPSTTTNGNTFTQSGGNTGTSVGNTSNTGTSNTTLTGTNATTSSATGSGTTSATGSATTANTATATGSANSNTNSAGNSTANQTNSANSTNTADGGNTIKRQVVGNQPVSTSSQVKGIDTKASITANYKGLGEYQNFNVPKSDASLLMGLVRSYLLLSGITPTTPSDKTAEVLLYVTVDVFGIVRDRTDVYIYNQEHVKAETSFEMTAYDRDGRVILAPTSSNREAHYAEHYLLWAGPFKSTERLQQGQGLLVDFSDVVSTAEKRATVAALAAASAKTPAKPANTKAAEGKVSEKNDPADKATPATTAKPVAIKPPAGGVLPKN
jgi:hypothetical protein